MTVKRTTRFAPITLWYGRYATSPIENLVEIWVHEVQRETYTTEELLRLRVKQIKEVDGAIIEATKKMSNSRLSDQTRWNSKRYIRKERLQVGDIVLLHDTSLETQWTKRLEARWMGPFRIIREVEGKAYELAELDGTRSHGIVSGSRLRKFILRDADLVPSSRRLSVCDS